MDLVDCKGCKKPFETYGRCGILRHIKVTKNCFTSYTNEEVDLLQLNSAKIMKLKKKENNKKYHVDNKNKRIEKNKQRIKKNGKDL